MTTPADPRSSSLKGTGTGTAHTEDRFHRLVSDLRLIVWDYDPQAKRFRYVSPQAEAILGYPLDQWQTPAFWFDHLHPDDREAAVRFSRAHVARGEDHEFEYRMLRRDGTAVWMRDLSSVVRDVNGRAVALQGVLIDITERKAAEEALAASEARYRAIVEDQTEMICRYLPDGRITYVNPAFRRTFAATIGEGADVIGMSVFVLAGPNLDRLQTLLASLTPANPVGSIDIEARGPDGTTRWRQWTNRALFDDAGRLREYQAVGRDITQRRLAEEALRHNEQALTHSNDQQRLLLSELNHRVRNNLASLLALLDISARESSSVHDFAASVRARVQAMSTVHSLLSRDQWQSVDLRELLLTLAPVGRQSAVRIDGPPVAIFARQAHAVGMVAQELFANSQKHGALREERGIVEVRWRIDDPDSAASLAVAIEDDLAAAGTASAGPAPRVLRIAWREQGGPPIMAKPRLSVGTSLIVGLVRAELRGETVMSYPRDGAAHEFTVLIDSA